jgi:choline kinase
MEYADKSFAIILAAGINSRLHPITEKMPKPLIKVCEREILDYQINGYLKAVIPEKNIYIVTGYMTEMIHHFLDSKYPSVKNIFNNDYLTTNNVYSLYLALIQIEEDTNFNFEMMFITNVDCIYYKTLI